MKLTMLAIGVMLAVISACLLGVVVLAGEGDRWIPMSRGSSRTSAAAAAWRPASGW